MAVDKTTLDGYLSGYKFYIDDLNSKNITGNDYDEVVKNYNRIIELGEQCTDVNDFNAKIQSENITTNISNAYTHAITEYTNKSMKGSVGSQVAGGVIMNAASRIAASSGINVNVPGVSQLGRVSGIGSKLKGLFSFFRKKKSDDSGSSKQYKTRRT